MTSARRHPIRSIVFVTAALFGLLAATVWLSRIGIGRAAMAAALSIAAAKALLLALYFMNIRWSNASTRIFAAAAWFWLALMLAGTLADYLSREF